MDLRRLDALVAEKVMGWPWRVWDRGKHPGKRFLAEPGMEGWMAAQGAEPLHDDAYALVPAFSADIAAAWQVVEKMRQDGFTVAVLAQVHHKPACEIARPEWSAGEYLEADTNPLAICLAALKALGVEVPKE